ncbi:Uncharacterised protein [Mycobacterium tuberculosis]|nr:Uncharacterised protein [Mycobacterium tuberculosis]SHB02607.1 Uncharacterised protein [Mycobacterium tuberculosis]
MLTPSSTASTAASPPAATSGTNTRVAGRLLTTLASTAASAAMPSSAGNPDPVGSTADILAAMPLSMTACTTTPRANTKTRNDTLTARAIRSTEVCPRRRLRSANTAAPASAAHVGASPTDSATAKPPSVSATTTSTNIGRRGAGLSCCRSGTTRRSRAKNQRKTT